MVTISDIAAALGVTPSTVSRALSGSPRVKEETRLAVEQMAAALGYERNIVASTNPSATRRVLLAAHKAMRDRGGMKVTHVNEIVGEVFDITGFADILTIE